MLFRDSQHTSCFHSSRGKQILKLWKSIRPTYEHVCISYKNMHYKWQESVLTMIHKSLFLSWSHQISMSQYHDNTLSLQNSSVSIVSLPNRFHVTICSVIDYRWLQNVVLTKIGMQCIQCTAMHNVVITKTDMRCVHVGTVL